MYKINTSTAVNKRFVDGNVSTQTPPTDLNAQWFNHIQGELVNAIEGLGGTVDGVNENSLATAINNFKTAIEARATSLEDSRTNHIGEIVMVNTHQGLNDALPCNGAVHNKSRYKDLIDYALEKQLFETSQDGYNSAIAHGRWGMLMHYGNDWTSDRFYVPMLSDVFLRSRGTNHQTLGTYQADELKGHHHFIANNDRAGLVTGASGNQVTYNRAGAANGHLVSEGAVSTNPNYNYSFLFNNTYPNVLRTSTTGGQETRPMNVSVQFWIRYR